MLDTSAYSQLRRDHPGLIERLESAIQISLSVVAFGELIAGFLGGPRPRENEAVLERFIGAFEVDIVEVNRSIAFRYGEIQSELKRKGRPVPANDLWIAASAMERSVELLTFDRDFRHIPGLRLAQWS
jgi:predicted nucleic acid-binding protein